ncbi:hypothetical protein M0R45_033996 [Rubus argutus]|uniref:Shugoshin C-terminal domain-containing protein n=1 Tax=Rubus argutus TaxID=59490 RepID=A0AAW1VRA0_RUBAR
MDAFVFDESENSRAGGTKTENEKKAKGARKTLGDISNIQQRQNKQAIQQVKQKFDSLTTKKYVENLTKENMALMKLLSDRNKVVELSRTELQNLRDNLEKVQQQNFQLAQANSQMLAEVTSSRDRLRILQHAIGCQTALLKVRKVEEKEKDKRARYQNLTHEVCSAKNVEPGESSQAVKETGNTNRKQQPQNLALGPPIVEAVQNNEKADNKRRLRRQSAISEIEEQETTEDLFDIKDDNKNFDVRSRRQLASAKNEELQATEDLSESKNENKRNLRRQSARFKNEEPEVTEEAKVTEDVSEINDDNFPVSSLCDVVVHESGSTCSLVKKEDEGNTAVRSEEQEFLRSSIRPLRRAAEKVKSYKEIPINVKMRQG